MTRVCPNHMGGLNVASTCHKPFYLGDGESQRSKSSASVGPRREGVLKRPTGYRLGTWTLEAHMLSKQRH